MRLATIIFKYKSDLLFLNLVNKSKVEGIKNRSARIKYGSNKYPIPIAPPSLIIIENVIFKK